MEKKQRKLKIMLIDDSQINIMVLKEMLAEENYAVSCFSDARIALRESLKDPPHLILLDIIMPDMDGFEFLKNVKSNAILQNIPVIFLSAIDDAAKKIKGFSAGCVDYITKPFREEEVLARVHTHLRLYLLQKKVEKQKIQLQENYDKLVEMEEQHDQLVQMILHDMQSPLMGILGYAQLLDMEIRKSGNETLNKRTNKLLNSCHTLQDMISSLLSINKLETTRFRKETHDVREIISQVLNSLKSNLKGTNLIYNPPLKPVFAFCYLDITRRIIQNLLLNAIKLSPPNSTIELYLSEKEQFVKIAVSDCGPVLEKEDLKKFWSNLNRITSIDGADIYSSGLGLTFCRLAVQAQGGEIGIENKDHEGNIFWFTLPAVS